MPPTTGRIVHFYDQDLVARDFHRPTGIRLNGQGAGPYPAIVLQTVGADSVNLRVMAWGGDWPEGSVRQGQPGDDGRYWCWPPRE